MPDITDQYRIIVSRAGWIDRSARGRLLFEGADAVSFLQALVTNDVEALAVGAGLYAAYLTPQGRMVTDVEIYRRPDGILGGVTRAMSAALATRFDQLIFSEDVRVSDVSSRTSEIVVVGGDAARIAGEALAVDSAALAALPELSQLDAGTGFVARIGAAGLPSFKIVLPAEERTGVVARLDEAGAVEISEALADALRIEAGRPEFGVDMTEETIPLEAGLLDRAISTTKGCYVGQEVIIRVLHRGGGRVARRLATLALHADGSAPAPGAILEDAGREIGRLTSVGRSPSSGSWIALGYVHRDRAEVGADFLVAGSSTHATVTGFAG